MKKKFLSLLVFIGIAFISGAQNLQSFTCTLQTSENAGISYLSIANKKACTQAEAKANKSAIDFALIITNDNSRKKTEWYNMSGKENVIPKELVGSVTLINAISFDKEQFDKCKTASDLKRMTGYITSNSFSHFAVIRNSIDYYQRCFIFEKPDKKRGLMFVTEIGNGQLSVQVKTE